MKSHGRTKQHLSANCAKLRKNREVYFLFAVKIVFAHKERGERERERQKGI